MIALTARPDGVLLPVRAQPGSRRSELRGDQEGALKVCVTQVAEKGKANKAVLEVLCKALQLRKSQIELVSGETSQQKRFLVRGLTVAQLEARLQRALGAS